MIRSKKLWLIAPLALASALHAGNVVADWTAIGSTTIVANGGKSSPASFVWFACSSLAMYDAVNAITGEYEPFYYRIAGPSDASIDAAAVAAAHRILVNYFPAQQAALDSQYNASLAALTASADAKTSGAAVGEAAANAVISVRTGDGLEANITYTPGSGPGAWIPTPPAYAAPLVPWLGQMRPFTMKSPGDQLPDPPRAFSSEPWSRDYNLTRNYGGTVSTVRSTRETEVGIFWTEHTGQQFARAFNDLVTNYNLGTADAARMMAMLWTGVADSLIGCFNAKYKYGFWRPVTAIQAGGQTPDTPADSTWTSLGTTPNHPEYPAAHGCATGAASTLIADFFGTTKVHIVTDSRAFSDNVHQHVFEDTRDLMDEVFWARIYAGFHFYHSLEAGRQLGETVAQGLARSHFRATQSRR
jgi:PAP2 superfamily